MAFNGRGEWLAVAVYVIEDELDKWRSEKDGERKIREDIKLLDRESGLALRMQPMLGGAYRFDYVGYLYTLLLGEAVFVAFRVMHGEDKQIIRDRVKQAADLLFLRVKDAIKAIPGHVPNCGPLPTFPDGQHVVP